MSSNLPNDAKLIRGLSLTDSILLLASGIIGSGIFLTAKDIAASTRFPWLFLGVWVLGLAVTLLAAFAFAELGAMFPEAGGQYVYIREAYGDFVAFLYGWMIFTVSVGGTIAALGAGLAEYMGTVFPALSANHAIFVVGGFTFTRGHAVSVSSIVLLTMANIFGLRKGAVLQNVATWIKFAAIGAFVILGVAFGKGSWSHYAPSSVSGPAGALSVFSGIGVALIAVFWAYDGWVYITWVAGEVKDPQKNLPRSLIGGLVLVGVLYIAINVIYLYALPMTEIAAQPAVAQAAASTMFGAGAARWLALMIAISCFGAMAPCIMSGARVYYAMAEDGVFFRSLARVSPRWHTPVGSLVLQAIWSIALALSGRYDQLFTYVIFMTVLSYALTVFAVFILRRKRPDAERPYRCSGYPWVPAVYVIFTGIWSVIVAAERTKESLAGVGIVLLGMPFYFYWKRHRTNGAATSAAEQSRRGKSNPL